MRHLRLSILLTVLLSFAVCVVAQEPVPATDRFPNIRASLEDGFYALAEQQARGVLRADPNEAEARDAVLLLAQALWGQKRYSEMLDLLADYDGEPGHVYWRARALFELREYGKALSELESGCDGMDGSPYSPAATRLKGRIEIVVARLSAAEDSFLLFAEAFPNHRDAVENQFDLAETYIAQKRIPDALSVYEALAAGSDVQGAQRARLKMAHALYSEAAEKDYDAARSLLAEVGADENARLAYRIDAYVDLAALEEQAGRPDESVAAMRKGIALSPDPNQRVPLKLSLARMLLRENDAPGALKLLEECRTEAPNATMATELQLEKAGALLQAKRFGDADDAYQVYLDVSGDPQGQAQAYFGKGVALSGLGRHAESATFFDKAEKAFTNPQQKARAVFKAGDAYYQAGRFVDAEVRYRAFVVGFPAHPDMPNALYQLGLTLAEIGRRSEAMTTFGIVEESHSESPFAEKAALRSADVMRASGQWEEALAKLAQIEQSYTNHAVAALCQHQRGLVLYKLDRFPEAQKAFEAVIADYPDSEYVPQASYMRGFCLYRQGQIDEAVDTCLAFVEEYPGSEWTPEVIFWLAERYYNEGDHAGAEPLFLRIATDFSGHWLAPRALYWAGRAAAARSDYVKAIERYGKVVGNYPASDLLPQTRFSQGDALTQLGEFARAILAFEEIIKNYPESDLVNAAWGRKGDCQFSLATENPERYEEAINSYQAILDRPSAPPALKMQAEYKIGRCLEKANLLDKAFSRYMNVVYTFINKNVERSPNSVRWFTRSAFGAASLKEQEKSAVEAVRIYGRVVEAGVPAAEEALKRIEKIKTDNWLLFQQAEETDNVGTDG